MTIGKYQIIRWSWRTYRIMGRRKWSDILERPTAWDAIYEWSARIGPFEIRKWTTTAHDYARAMKKGNDE